MRLLPRPRFTTTQPGRITFCEACSQVCETACRADAQRRRARSQVQSSLLIRL